jgi:ribosomal protein L5
MIHNINEGIAEAYDKNKKVLGKMAVVNRVRGGKVQLRRAKSNVAGYKIHAGVVSKMTPEETRTRKIAGKIGARKRRAEMSKILRKRMISTRVRTSRLGS